METQFNFQQFVNYQQEINHKILETFENVEIALTELALELDKLAAKVNQ